MPPPLPPSEHVYFELEEFRSLDSDAPKQVYAEIEDFSNNRPAVPPTGVGGLMWKSSTDMLTMMCANYVSL